MAAPEFPALVLQGGIAVNNVNKTLYIPLYGKAFVSAKGILLRDPKAEKIWAAEEFALKAKSKSKWLAYYMAMRARVFDDWLAQQLALQPDAVVLHLGCGMDSRIDRVGNQGHLWYDVDFPEVIQERSRYFQKMENYHMVGADICDSDWLEAIPGENAIVVMEGISMYLHPEKLKAVFAGLKAHFASVHILMDCYSTFAAKASRYKNPINDVGVHAVYGMDEPKLLESTGMRYIGEHDMTPAALIAELEGLEKKIFSKLYAGKTARSMYHIYEYET